MKGPTAIPVLIGILVGMAAPAMAQTFGTASGPGPAANCKASLGDLPKIWEGKAYAISGDSLTGIGLKPTVRLWGIHAPPLTAPMSGPAMRARAALEDMLTSGEHKVTCRMAGWDGLCRALAECSVTTDWPTGSVAKPHDLGARLVEDGFAYGFELGSPPDWDKDASERIAHFEAIARQGRKGLWSDWLDERPRP
jgi:endonuclease YncB( thermonuclease family)